jgi:hypothetical protein
MRKTRGSSRASLPGLSPLAATVLVGLPGSALPDSALREARDRVRAAVLNGHDPAVITRASSAIAPAPRGCDDRIDVDLGDPWLGAHQSPDGCGHADDGLDVCGLRSAEAVQQAGALQLPRVSLSPLDHTASTATGSPLMSGGRQSRWKAACPR